MKLIAIALVAALSLPADCQMTAIGSGQALTNMAPKPRCQMDHLRQLEGGEYDIVGHKDYLDAGPIKTENSVQSSQLYIRIPRLEDHKKIDLGLLVLGGSGNPLCSHDVWYALSRNPELKARMKPDAQLARSLRVIAQGFEAIDKNAASVSAAADKVYAALQRLGPIESFQKTSKPFQALSIVVTDVKSNPNFKDLSAAGAADGAAINARKEALQQLLVLPIEQGIKGSEQNQEPVPGTALEAYHAALIKMSDEIVHPKVKVNSPEEAVNALAKLDASFEAVAANPDLGWLNANDQPKSHLADRDLRLRNQIYTNFAIIRDLVAKVQNSVAAGGGLDRVLGGYDAAIKEVGGKKDPVKNAVDVDRLKQQLYTEHKLDQYFDNKGTPKEGAISSHSPKEMAEAKALHDAIYNGTLVYDGKTNSQTFQFTHPGKKEAVVVPVAANEGKPGYADDQTVKKISTALIDGNVPAAKTHAAAAAFTGALFGSRPPLEDEKKRGGPSCGWFRAPSKAPKLGDYEKKLDRKSREDAAARSAARQQLEKEKGTRLAANQAAFEKKVGPFATAERIKNEPELAAAAKEKETADAEVNRWYEEQKAFLKKQDDEAQKQLQDDKASGKGKFVEQVAARVEFLRNGAETVHRGKTQKVKGWIEDPDQARRYVGAPRNNPAWWDYVIKQNLLKAYFDQKFPASKADPYNASVDACLASARFNDLGSIDACVGKGFDQFLKDLAAAAKQRSAPAKGPQQPQEPESPKPPQAPSGTELCGAGGGEHCESPPAKGGKVSP